MRTALVTGVVGQDGAYLSRHLLRAGYRVIGTSTPAGARSQFEAAYLAGVHMRRVDLTDAAQMRALLEAERPDEIYNLAAISSVSASWDRPLEVSQVNGIAVLALLEMLVELRAADGYSPRVCQASSAEIFGTPVSLPQDEGHPVRPTNPYAVAKAFAHFSAANFREAHGMFVSSVILFNHESALRPAHFVTRKITSAAVEIAAGKREVLELGRLDIRRDWGFAGDHVEAMHAALQADRPGDYCVATGRSHSLLEFASLAFEAAGVEDFDRIRSNPAFVRPTDIPEMVGSTVRARAELGWAPVTPLSEVVARMVAVDGRRMVTGVEHHPDYL